ncbi:UDP-Glycosyltransferase superfamily protein isoform 1 [Quillaja saponaria]|uniref:UDP-Glycosyltransferase superfamily protein isoform 1 n=1 Tax=Quillaja saponaria TaxID=32244 RepID=A0AAD7PQ16_QUISA|nr:UDP-Glycosyltransferase superfamily protein isoform 1 [Quillaja saponaria]
MEESNNRGEFQGNVVRQSPLRSGGGFKSTLSGRSTPQNSPSFRRLNSSRTLRREARSSIVGGQWFRSNRLLFWLLLITLWAYLGFYVQSRWAHGDNKEEFLGFGSRPSKTNFDSGQSQHRDLLASNSSLSTENGKTEINVGKEIKDKRIDVALTKKRNVVPPHRNTNGKKRRKRPARNLRGNGRGKQKATMKVERIDIEEQEPDIPKTNTSYGLLVGPFGLTEDRVLEWSPEKRSGTCDRKTDFRTSCLVQEIYLDLP